MARAFYGWMIARQEAFSARERVRQCVAGHRIAHTCFSRWVEKQVGAAESEVRIQCTRQCLHGMAVERIYPVRLRQLVKRLPQECGRVVFGINMMTASGVTCPKCQAWSS